MHRDRGAVGDIIRPLHLLGAVEPQRVAGDIHRLTGREHLDGFALSRWSAPATPSATTPSPACARADVQAVGGNSRNRRQIAGAARDIGDRTADQPDAERRPPASPRTETGRAIASATISASTAAANAIAQRIERWRANSPRRHRNIGPNGIDHGQQAPASE